MTMDRSTGDVQLIRLVKQYQYLYDTGSDNYKNVKLKDNTWKKISLAAGLSVDVSKTRWKSLRTSYLRHCKLIACRKGTKCRKWLLADELSFLNPYLVPTDCVVGANGAGPEEPEPLSEDAWARVYDDASLSARPPHEEMVGLDEDDEIEEIVEQPPVEELRDAFAFDAGEAPPDSAASESSFSSSLVASPAAEPDSAVSRGERGERRSRPTGSSGSAAGATPAAAPPTPDDDARRQRDTTRDFFLYLADTVKTFPPFLQAQVKGKCFEAVNTAELSLVSPAAPRVCKLGNVTPVHR